MLDFLFTKAIPFGLVLLIIHIFLSLLSDHGKDKKVDSLNYTPLIFCVIILIAIFKMFC